MFYTVQFCQSTLFFQTTQSGSVKEFQVIMSWFICNSPIDTLTHYNLIVSWFKQHKIANQKPQPHWPTSSIIKYEGSIYQCEAVLNPQTHTWFQWEMGVVHPRSQTLYKLNKVFFLKHPIILITDKLSIGVWHDLKWGCGGDPVTQPDFWCLSLCLFQCNASVMADMPDI